MNRKKRKTFLLWILPVMTGLAIWILHFETVARYRASLSLSIPEIGVALQTLVLEVPESPREFIYDGTEQEARLELPEDIMTAGTLKATDAGTYEIILSLKDPETSEWSDGTKENKILRWRIAPRSVRKPTVEDTERIFSGEVERPVILDLEENYVQVKGDPEETGAGRYTVRFSLKDPANTRWSDGTVEDLEATWMIGVCRIGETLYPSVTEAFSTGLSNENYPVEMLCDWRENAVNESGADYFSLNGYSLKSDGITLENKGTLTVLGGGTIGAEGSAYKDLACVRNQGNLYIEGGAFSAKHTGMYSSGIEVYGIWSVAGRTVIRGGEFTVSGALLAADGIYSENGSVQVENGTFQISNTATDHGAYVIWQEAGEITVLAGTFNCRAKNSVAQGYRVINGLMTVSGGVTEVSGGAGQHTSLFFAEKQGEIHISGGTHEADCYGESFGAAASNGGTFELSGGCISVCVNSRTEDTNGILISGGTGKMSGGEVAVYSTAAKSGSGIGLAYGEMEVTGGTVTVDIGGASLAYGVNIYEGSCSVRNLSMEVNAPNGRTYGFVKSASADLTVQSGQFTLRGDFVTAGECSLPTKKISTPVANADCAFQIFYKSGWTIGANWSNEPFVRSASRIVALSVLRSVENTNHLNEFGSLQVSRDRLGLYYIETGENGLSGELKRLEFGEMTVENGEWSVREEVSENIRRLILQTDGETEDSRACLVSVSARRGILVVCTDEQAAQLRCMVKSGFFESLAGERIVRSTAGIQSALPVFERTGFVWAIEEYEVKLNIYTTTGSRGTISKIVAELSFDKRETALYNEKTAQPGRVAASCT